MRSWGNLPAAPPAHVRRPVTRDAPLPDAAPLLAWGNGRSYGDVCLNSGGTLIQTRGLDRFIAFDAEQGILRAEAGVLLADIIDLVAPRGWFPAVTPGTRFITLGGAIANDVHGKNHHRAGTFGGHVTAFELLRSDGQRLYCSAGSQPELYAATIGGLGLTGMITWAEIRLRRIAGPLIRQRQQRFHGLDEFFALNREAELASEHVVAWIDCLAPQPRGILIAGDHEDGDAAADVAAAANIAVPPTPTFGSLGVPFTPPLSLVNRLTLKAFNHAYFRRPLAQGPVHYLPFFYPLDGIAHWNRLYGRAGFFQYQCVLPEATGRDALAEMLDAVAASGEGSFLAVLKTFGAAQSPGLLSYPMPGINLALDFPNRDASTGRLLHRLDSIVLETGGRLYAAKDARMPARLFHLGYPDIARFLPCIDPAFSSNFWRRIMETS